MPALPSFITYKPGRKTKAVIRSPFSYLRGDHSTSTPTPAATAPPFATEVIDINDRGARYSLDFDGGKPIDEYENDILDQDPRAPRTDTSSSSPQVQLDIDLSPEALTDWFAANFLQSEAPVEGERGKPGGSGLRNEVKVSSGRVGSDVSIGQNSGINGEEEDDDEGFSTSSEDVLANLQAMDASHFGKLPGSDFKRLDQASSSPMKPSPLSIPAGSSQDAIGQGIRSADTSIGHISSRLSYMDTPASSAISGTTLARALLSNTFVLSNDNRISRYRSGLAGLTRSDSTTLPHEDHTIAAANHDRFSIGPDAPPIPSNAEFLYEPPKKRRTQAEWREKKRQDLKRRSSTGSLHPKLLPETPSTRPNSALLSPGAEFDINSILKSPAPQTPLPVPRSPLPPTPKMSKFLEEEMRSEQGSSLSSYQEVIRPLPMGPQTPSPEFNLLSPSASSDGFPSEKNMDDVLNYYSLPDSPEPLIAGANYRPAVSPISEESSSQLSPPIPYRDRRESQRNTPIGARSPLSGSLRVRGESVLLPRKPSDARPHSRQMLAPVGERPQSTIQIPSPTSSQRSSLASAASDLLAPLAPPPVSNIFNRQRSGSAPSPIKVVRDSKDVNAYNITVSPSDSETPMTEEGDVVTQEFPETPNMFSPLFTGATDASGVNMQPLYGHDVSPMPTTPSSAAIPGRGNTQPSLVQQLLLNRAGTSVRHSRQTSIGKIKTTGIGGRSSSPSNRRIAQLSAAPEVSPSAEEIGSAIDQHDSTDDLLSLSPEEQAGGLNSHTVNASRSSSRGTSIVQSDGSSMYTSSEYSTKAKVKSLPAIPRSPPRSASPATTARSSVHMQEPAPMVAPAAGPVIPPPPSIPPPSPTPSQKARPPPPRGRLPPALMIESSNPSGSEQTVAVNGSDIGQDSPASSTRQGSNTADTTAPAVIASGGSDNNSLPDQSSLTYKEDNFTGRASDIFRGTSLGSPPPYYTVVNEHLMNHTHTPNTSFSNGASFPLSDQSSGPIAGPSSVDWSNNADGRAALARENSMISQRARMRPPLPAGPRRPSQQQIMMNSPNTFPPMRDRSGSVSSVTSNPLLQAARVRSSPVFSPKFQTPAPKWRGYTMEAAKWTFTSAQLQAIVSRAIRQSAEASSIRLLRLDVLDNEIPDEIRRLEAQRTDLKTRYKVLTRTRATLLDALTTYMTGTEEDNSSYALRLLEDLREIVSTLDRLAEELHSLDGQLAYLDSLTHVHTGSALAMALRKLNASFLKQVAENQVLRNQVQTLEAERDEAWQQAEVVANDYDRMNDKIDSPSSKRSSRVSAVRKSSVRVSKAGLRTPSQRLSQISSLGSAMHGCAPPSSSRSPLLRLERMPPVPPVPRRRPFDILTDSPIRSSAALSTSGFTPTSETQALVKAQDELYAMLGIINPDNGLRRSRSVNELPITSPSAISAQPTLLPPAQPSDTILSRRSSLPGNSTLAEAYNAMAADRNAVLATIDMLSATD